MKSFGRGNKDSLVQGGKWCYEKSGENEIEWKKVLTAELSCRYKTVWEHYTSCMLSEHQLWRVFSEFLYFSYLEKMLFIFFIYLFL